MYCIFNQFNYIYIMLLNSNWGFGGSARQSGKFDNSAMSMHAASRITGILLYIYIYTTLPSQTKPPQ